MKTPPKDGYSRKQGSCSRLTCCLVVAYRWEADSRIRSRSVGSSRFRKRHNGDYVSANLYTAAVAFQSLGPFKKKFKRNSNKLRTSSCLTKLRALEFYKKIKYRSIFWNNNKIARSCPRSASLTNYSDAKKLVRWTACVTGQVGTAHSEIDAAPCDAEIPQWGASELLSSKLLSSSLHQFAEWLTCEYSGAIFWI
jgi:hypothetical protein